jgi:hypothetical protein
MWYDFYEKKWLVYGLLAAGGVGALAKLGAAGAYARLKCASEDMGSSKNKLMKLLCLKFETFYRLQIGVNNVDSFVDKYVKKEKFSGIYISTLENIGGQMVILCLAGGVLGSVWGYALHCGQDRILYTFLCGTGLAFLLTIFDKICDIRGKKESLRVNMCDYLENYLKAKLEHEHLAPEALENYRKAYFVEKLKKPKKQKTSPLLEETAAVQERIIEDVLEEYLL